jgi:hypothetical protein
MSSNKMVHQSKSLFIKALSLILKNAVNHFWGFYKSFSNKSFMGDFSKIMIFGSPESQKFISKTISLPCVSRLYSGEPF